MGVQRACVLGVVWGALWATACGGGLNAAVQGLGQTECPTSEGRPTASDFAADTELLAIGRSDGFVELRRVPSGALEACGAHDAPITNLAFSPDGTRLATADHLGRLQISELDLSGAEVVGLLRRHDGRSLRSGR